MRDPKIKADEATIAKSLQGHWREEHIFELTQALGLYRVYQDKIAQCNREIEAQLERFEDHSNWLRYDRITTKIDSFVERPVRDGPWSARVSGREAPRAVGC